MLEDKLRDAAAVITISDYNKKYLEKKFPEVDSQKIKIVHCGLDLKKFSPRPHYLLEEMFSWVDTDTSFTTPTLLFHTDK